MVDIRFVGCNSAIIGHEDMTGSLIDKSVTGTLIDMSVTGTLIDVSDRN